MYIPNSFREEDTEKLIAFMRANSFATLVSIQNGMPIASHIPLVVTVKDGSIRLVGHLAKQNAQWQTFGQSESLAIFTGAHAYISPTLYESQESVPTWNYIAVHAYGIPQIITLDHSAQRMNEMIDTMIHTYEDGYHAQWHGLSDRYREGMMNGIVGFEMPITRLEGKYKLSQNRSQADQHAIADALMHNPDPNAYAIGVAVQENLQRNEQA